MYLCPDFHALIVYIFLFKIVDMLSYGCPFFVYVLILTRGHFFIVFRDKKGERVRDRGRNIDVREKYQLVAFLYTL